MKKLIFIWFIALLALPALQAQEYFRMGAKGGVNFANIVGDDAEGDMRTSFHLGLVAELPFADKFFFGPEVLYSSQGTKDGDDELKLDYVQVPLMVRYYVTEGFNVEAGPQLGFLTKAEGNIEGEDGDVKDYFKDFEYGLNFGLGYKLFNGIFFQGRYNLGLAKVFDSDKLSDDLGFDVGEIKSKNSVIQLSVGYMF